MHVRRPLAVAGFLALSGCATWQPPHPLSPAPSQLAGVRVALRVENRHGGCGGAGLPETERWLRGLLAEAGLAVTDSPRSAELVYTATLGASALEGWVGVNDSCYLTIAVDEGSKVIETREFDFDQCPMRSRGECLSYHVGEWIRTSRFVLQFAEARAHGNPASAEPPAAQPAAPAPVAGCGKDTDCKGDRVCVNHECVSPKP